MLQLVGRALVSLKNLLYEVPVEHELLVVNEAAEVCGRLRVALQPGQLIRDLDASGDELHTSRADMDERTVDFTGFPLGWAEEHRGSTWTNADSNKALAIDRSPFTYAAMPTDALPVTAAEEATNDIEGGPLQSPGEVAAVRKLLKRLGHKFRFVVTILDACDVPTDFAQVFCQFKFTNSVC
jgi:kinesin family protein 1